MAKLFIVFTLLTVFNFFFLNYVQVDCIDSVLTYFVNNRTKKLSYYKRKKANARAEMTKLSPLNAERSVEFIKLL